MRASHRGGSGRGARVPVERPVLWPTAEQSVDFTADVSLRFDPVLVELQISVAHAGRGHVRPEVLPLEGDIVVARHGEGREPLLASHAQENDDLVPTASEWRLRRMRSHIGVQQDLLDLYPNCERMTAKADALAHGGSAGLARLVDLQRGRRRTHAAAKGRGSEGMGEHGQYLGRILPKSIILSKAQRHGLLVSCSRKSRTVLGR